ncbi:ABC transporter permease [Compostimonas suwonensis]|uniref:ABC-2 family transporter n=1 Tax=Compostimonas suwonensis TaxID=1048394 RepID=A0A2M9C3W7_9MICO|nr:ABC transporter permease [Compostimonas suwonensis]PJJ65224.1 hypothetical protein CLV54_0253 [Compostimonas suwonensis]
MNAFARAVGAEFLKIFSTRLWWVLGLILFGYVGLCAAGAAALFGTIPANGEAAGVFGSLPPLVYSFATSIGYVFPVLFGALATTGEFRHQTLTPTFLASPLRGQVLAAKCVSVAAVGAVYAIVALVASVGLGALVLGLTGIDPQLGDPAIWAQLGRSVLAMLLWAFIGVGLGALIPSQVGAIVVVLAFTQFVEPLLRLASGIADWTAQVGKFLPGAASDALVGASFFTVASPASALLEWWQGALVLFAIGLVATVIGFFTSWRRDVS